MMAVGSWMDWTERDKGNMSQALVVFALTSNAGMALSQYPSLNSCNCLLSGVLAFPLISLQNNLSTTVRRILMNLKSDVSSPYSEPFVGFLSYTRSSKILS